MTEHPITPPPELVQQWTHGATEAGLVDEEIFAARAAQWGADQELEACCEWAQGYAECGDSLRAARRPKPQSLKQQALCALIDGIARGGNDPSDIDTIRRALDLLPD
jgi:hypothetical protein